MTWIDCGVYWHYDVEQGIDEWLEIKKGRCSGTSNNGESRFDTKENIAMYVAGVKKKTFSGLSLEKITYGVRKEPRARKYYEKQSGVKVTEMGFCIPKYNTNIGVSVDGMVGSQGIVEIKCPYEMYPRLENKKNSGYSGYGHIFKSHFKQMQMGMAITNTKWCDYIVYSRDRKVYIERIPFDPVFWKKLYGETVEFWTDYVKPHLKGTKYPIKVGTK